MGVDSGIPGCFGVDDSVVRLRMPNWKPDRTKAGWRHWARASWLEHRNCRKPFASVVMIAGFRGGPVEFAVRALNYQRLVRKTASEFEMQSRGGKLRKGHVEITRELIRRQTRVRVWRDWAELKLPSPPSLAASPATALPARCSGS